MQGFSGTWWQALFDDSIPGSHADRDPLGGAHVRSTSRSSSARSRRSRAHALDGVPAALPGRRRSLLPDHARADDAGVPAQPRHLALLAVMGKTRLAGATLEFGGLAAIGTNVVWAIPFGFLVMVAVWNRYDARVEEASRDLGASSAAHVPRGDAAARLDRALRRVPVRLHALLERVRPDGRSSSLGHADAADPDLRADRRLGHPARPLRARDGDDALHPRSSSRSCSSRSRSRSGGAPGSVPVERAGASRRSSARRQGSTIPPDSRPARPPARGRS